MYYFRENVSLKPYNTFALDSRARYWAEFTETEQLEQIIGRCRSESLEWMVLSGGSNIIFRGDFDGVVIHPCARGLNRESDGLLVVDAAVVWDELVAYCVASGLQGLENLSGIPGYVGASPVQNVGAYGVEAGDVIRWVEYFDTQDMTLVRVAGEECGFGYRESIFKHELRGRAVVTRVAFALSSGSNYNVGYGDLRREVEARGGATLETIRQAVLAIRRSKLPDPARIANAGSFFKNPVVTRELAADLRVRFPEITCYDVPMGVKIPAGWLIDAAGWRGFRSGAVGVHQRQALVLVNYGGATAVQILELARMIQRDILSKFGVAIEMEVNVL